MWYVVSHRYFFAVGTMSAHLCVFQAGGLTTVETFMVLPSVDFPSLSYMLTFVISTRYLETRGDGTVPNHESGARFAYLWLESREK